jgi:hypothetical protein
MPFNNIPQVWSGLTSGEPVSVTEPGRGAYSARVDTKTEDSAVVWVIDDKGQRRAFDHREGVRIVRAPEATVFA